METFEVRARRQREWLDAEDARRESNRSRRRRAIDDCAGCDDHGRLLDGRFCSHDPFGDAL